MLTFNRPQLLDRAIESVRSQDLESWELIVVHDGPNQEIRRILENWVSRDSRVRYFHREQPGNIAEATNFGIARARGEFIAILDDDDRWACPDKLSRQVAFLRRNPSYAGCGGGVIVVDEWGRESMRYQKPEFDAAIRRHALIANPAAHSTMMYRKTALDACGGYDESLPGFQDWDLWLRMLQIGKLYNFPDYFLEYTIWEGGGSFFQRRKNTRSALRIVWRHRRTYPRFLPALLLALSYHAYAHLPNVLTRSTFPMLSRLKKALFSASSRS